MNYPDPLEIEYSINDLEWRIRYFKRCLAQAEAEFDIATDRVVKLREMIEEAEEDLKEKERELVSNAP